MSNNYRELTGREKQRIKKAGYFSLRQLRQRVRLPAIGL